jgi:hypothetical protein
MPGSVQCLPCQSGRFNDTAGAQSCGYCPIGKYSASAQQCQNCDAGKYGALSETGEPTCFPCSAGSFSASTGNAECQPCSLGRFAEAGAQQCQFCQPGSYSAQTGAVRCTLCERGFYRDAPGGMNSTIVHDFEISNQSSNSRCLILWLHLIFDFGLATWQVLVALLAPKANTLKLATQLLV